MELGESLDAASLQQILRAIVRVHEPQLFWLKECVIAYKESHGKIHGFPPISSIVVVLEAMQARLQELKDLFISRVEKNIDEVMKLAVDFNVKGYQPSDQEILRQYSIKNITEVAKKAEASIVENICLQLDTQIEQVADLIDEVKRIVFEKTNFGDKFYFFK